MWKHIVGQSICEIAILLILYLMAPKFIPEDKEDIIKSAENIYYCFGKIPGVEGFETSKILYGNKEKWESDTIFDKSVDACRDIFKGYGDYDNETYEHWGNVTLNEFYDKYITSYGGTTHMTLIFDVFVVYTLFNQINCRIIDDSFNTFKRINKGIMFCLVTLCELVIQIILSQVGRQVFHCVIGGLSFYQWLICLGFSISTMVFNFIIKLIPIDRTIDKYTKPPLEDQQQKAKYSRTTFDEIVNKNLKE
jgi:hypothetical protein